MKDFGELGRVHKDHQHLVEAKGKRRMAIARVSSEILESLASLASVEREECWGVVSKTHLVGVERVLKRGSSQVDGNVMDVD